MEGETSASIANQMKLFNERVLPTLDDNIKSGNSLIDLDFYDGQLDFGGERRIKPFSWKKGFPEVFKNGGFDFIIGNPPYVLISPDLFSNEVIEYFKRFKVAEYKIDLYHLFIERGLGLLKPSGSLGFILPSTWMTQKFTDKLRKFVLEQSSIEEVLHFDYKVFDQADVFTEIIILNNSKPPTDHKIRFIREEGSVTSGKVLASNVMSEIQKSFLKVESFAIDIRSLTRDGKIVSKITKNFPPLEQVARASLGAQAYNSSKHSKSEIENRVFHSDKKLSKEYLPELAGNDVGRYTLDRKKGQWIKYGPWLHDYRSMDWLTGPRILIREITGKDPYKIQGTYTEETYCNYKTILNVSPSEKTNFSMKYLCGLLNSKLLSFIFKNSSNKIEANSFPRLSVGDIKKLPIKDIDFKNQDEKSKHDEITKLVAEIIRLNIDLKTMKLSDKVEQVQDRLDHLNDKIDKIVYQLYNLKQSDIDLVERG